MLAFAAEQIAAIITGIGGILAAIGGVLILLHEARRKERKAAEKELNEISDSLVTVRAENVHLHTEIHRLRILLADHGIEDHGEPH